MHRAVDSGGVESFVVIVFGLAGLGVGAVGRWFLARMRRGARVPVGPSEAACAVLFAVIAWRWLDGLPTVWVPVPLVLAAVAVPLTVVDLVRLRLPDVLTAAAALGSLGALGAVAVVAGQPWVFGRAIVAALVLTIGYLAAHVLAPAGLGLGDVKLAATSGAVLGAVGWPALLVGAGLASVVTLVLAAFGRLARVSAWRSGTPHGPGMLVAAWLVCVFPGTGLGVA